MTRLRSFLARFRDAVATTSISVGPVSVTLWQQPERGESPLKSGHIEATRHGKRANPVNCGEIRE